MSMYQRTSQIWVFKILLLFLFWCKIQGSYSFQVHHSSSLKEKRQQEEHPTRLALPNYNTRFSFSSPSSSSDNLQEVQNDDNNILHNKHKKIMTSSSSNTKTSSSTVVVPTAILRIHGPDQKGIVAAFAQLLHGHGCNIVDSEQHASDNIFFQRISFDYSTMLTDSQSIETGIKDVCERFGMHSDLNWGRRKKRVAIMVSKYDHCLWELLLRRNTGDIDCDISVIISNHPDLKHVADTFGIPFEVYQMTKATKVEQEEKELDTLQNKYNVDLVILARYMQIISSKFCDTFQHRVINIHHSFLPAFVGGKPYHRAHERGVKLVGATAHYATADLDEGPIIEQDITRISHRDEVDDLLRKGRILERNVLVAAVKAHLEDRILVYGNKTVVFGE